MRAIGIDEVNEAARLAGSGHGWNGRFLAALHLFGYGLMRQHEAERLGFLGRPGAPMHAPVPRYGCADDPPYPYPCVIVPEYLATIRGR